MKKISKKMRKKRKIKKRRTLLSITYSLMYVKMKMKRRIDFFLINNDMIFIFLL